MGEEAEAVLASTNVDEEERKSYDSVVKKFDDFFKVRKNVIYERARFNRRNQLQGETAEQYIMVLYDLAENCDYGTMKDEMIRDRLVVGIRDDSLSQKLQMDASLTLEKAKKEIRQKEAVHEQQQSLRGASNTSLEAVHSNAKPMNRRGQQRQQQGRQNRPRLSPTGKSCMRCGQGQHLKEKCPAREAVCHGCLRVGHYSFLCRSKTVAVIATNGSSPSPTPYMDTAFMDTMSSASDEKAWLTTIRIGEKTVKFKLDTGAEVTAVTKQTYQYLGKPQLCVSDKVLYGPSRHTLGVLGKFRCELTHGHKVTQQGPNIMTNLS